MSKIPARCGQVCRRDDRIESRFRSLKNAKNNMLQQKNHIHGFDYGRAIFSLFVVLWHTHAVGLPDVWNTTAAAPYRPTLVDHANFAVLLTAVPFFILTSCYLYVMKGGGASLLLSRIRRLGTLAAFWSLSYIVFASGYKGLDGALQSLVTMPVRSLVYAFGTVYYFFVALPLALMVCEVIRRTKGAVTWLAFGILSAIVPVMQWLAATHGILVASAYWNPFNFFPYSVAAVILYRNRVAIMNRAWYWIAALSFLAVAFVTAEWAALSALGSAPNEGNSMPPYTRLSLLWTSLAVCILLLRVSRPAGAVIAAMSRNSLALYCAHPFMILLLQGLLPNRGMLGLATIAASYAVILLVLRPALSPRLLT